MGGIALSPDASEGGNRFAVYGSGVGGGLEDWVMGGRRKKKKKKYFLFLLATRFAGVGGMTAAVQIISKLNTPC